jgi:SAM-dependent methyltransferase
MSFDDYEPRYGELVERSISFAGRDHDFYVRVKAERLLELVERHVGDPARQRVLDVGCGPGLAHGYLGDLKMLEGVDASPLMVERAQRANPSRRYEVADAVALPFSGGSFDVAFAIGLLHHIAPAARAGCVGELRRVVRPSGLVVIFEHNPLNPLTRLAVHRCEFDDDALLLRRSETLRRVSAAGLQVVETRWMLFSVRNGAGARALERALGRTPLGAQYYVAARV